MVRLFPKEKCLSVLFHGVSRDDLRHCVSADRCTVLWVTPGSSMGKASRWHGLCQCGVEDTDLGQSSTTIAWLLCQSPHRAVTTTEAGTTSQSTGLLPAGLRLTHSLTYILYSARGGT